jgi:hypothetical protein
MPFLCPYALLCFFFLTLVQEKRSSNLKQGNIFSMKGRQFKRRKCIILYKFNLHSDINQAYLVVAGVHKHLSLIRMQFDVIDAILLFKKIGKKNEMTRHRPIHAWFTWEVRKTRLVRRRSHLKARSTWLSLKSIFSEIVFA